ncbi:unnamed protein product [Oppiella nova]|uniref:ABC transporter domain-containing protein n=1 Tax=Oppiella nova TaxID=334625 RepID=A0A7R9LUU5_9ACAR|nr:unnamed protein product [Oppiella nova]CAG2167181.1 unnamed protein product [Oppiella nova]
MDYMDESHPLIGVEDNCSEYDSIEQLTLELDRSSNNSNGSNNNDRRSQSSVSQSMAISWHNIRVSSRPSNMFKRFRKSSTEPTEILKNVSGEVSAGQLLAIMGSSGAGKTTLLNVLTARNLSKLVVCGDVLLNGEVVDANTITSISAYVQQQDLFVPVLTVREHLIFHSLLRMDPNLPQKERTDRVNEVILRFSLTKCANTRIGSSTTFKGISGGESKRLAFASEYLTDPSIIDEPTSGLDSFMAQSIVQELKSMASEGRTVICTIHQPSSQHICDKFANKLSDTLSDTTDMVSAALFMDSFSVFERKSALNGHKYRTSIWRQLWTLLWRSKKFILRDTEFRWMFVIVPIAIFLGSVYWKQQVNQRSIRNINAALFVLVMNMTIQSAMAVINTFCAEQPLFLREHHNGIHGRHTHNAEIMTAIINTSTQTTHLATDNRLKTPANGLAVYWDLIVTVKDIHALHTSKQMDTYTGCRCRWRAYETPDDEIMDVHHNTHRHYLSHYWKRFSDTQTHHGMDVLQELCGEIIGCDLRK